MEMIGMDRNTGKALTGVEHLRQSIIDILTTPRGSRCIERGYGSRIFELIDARVSKQQMIYEVADAISRHEPRFKLKRVLLDNLTPHGVVTIAVEGSYQGEEITMEVVG